MFALEKVPWKTFFLQKPSLSAIKSAVDDILSLVNDVLLLEKSPFCFLSTFIGCQFFYYFFSIVRCWFSKKQFRKPSNKKYVALDLLKLIKVCTAECQPEFPGLFQLVLCSLALFWILVLKSLNCVCVCVYGTPNFFKKTCVIA